MEDRGSATANHFDHVHVSFRADGATSEDPRGWSMDKWNVGGAVSGAADALNPLAGLQPLIDVIQWVSDPQNLLRVAMAIAGAALIIFALLRFDKLPATIRKAVA